MGMFLSAFLAATILPLSSELVLSALYKSGFSSVVLLSLASVGNVLGSLVNYELGYKFGKSLSLKWLRLSERAFERATAFFAKWGRWSLLLSWVPVVGDPLTLAAGVLKTNKWFFLATVGISKTARYAALLYLLH